MQFELPDIDNETLAELYETIYESLDAIEISLNRLLNNPADQEALNELFRELHSVKGNFRVCIMSPFSDYIHGIEEIFGKVRTNSLDFTPSISEITLGAIDKLRAKMEFLLKNGKVDIDDMVRIGDGCLAIANAGPDQIDACTTDLLRQISGTESNELPIAVELDNDQPVSQSEIDTIGLENDIKYFQMLSALLDMRLPSWLGRTPRLMGVISAVLPYLPYQINQQQLNAAVYIHDIGMAFIPNEVLLASKKITEDQYTMITKHPHVGHQLLQRLGRWSEAATMVLQHHERIDGNGYPYGLKGDEICSGAKVLAVADSFCSLTSTRPDRSQRRTVLRALMEINNHIGTQFDEATVTAFTKMATEKYSKH